MNKESALTAIGLPGEFGAALLILGLVLLLAPYFAGHDFGAFKIPAFKPALKRRLRVLGPAIFVLVVVMHIPIIQTESPTPAVPKSPPAADVSGPGSVKIESSGARGTATVGESQVSEYNSASILVFARDSQTGAPITDLAPRGHTGNCKSVILLPVGVRLITKLVPPGGCVLEPTNIYNDHTGAYTLSVMTVAKTGPCPWKKGQYHYLLEVNTSEHRGQSFGTIVID